jgi:hypothetical protein
MGSLRNLATDVMSHPYFTSTSGQNQLEASND